MAAAAATTTAATASSFIGTRLPDIHPGSSRVQARFGFGAKKAPPKRAASKNVPDRPLWYPGAKAPEYLDGSLVGDYGFDPFGLGKPVEYLQFDLDSLDQNLAKNLAGDIIGTRTESSDVKSTPFQPYSEVFGLQRFRECELIHGRWAMLATLGALTVEWLTGVTWQDAGKASIQLRTQNRDLGMAMREVDDDLAIFLGLKNGEEERNDHLLINDSNMFDDSLISKETKPDSLLISKALEVEAVEIVGDDSLLNLEVENQRSDHDWLTPEKIDTKDSAINQTCSSKDESISIKSELVNSCENRGPSSCRDRKANSRASTPTRRPSLPAKSKHSRASTPISELSRASLRATSTSSKPVGVQVRSSTPSKSSSRSSTPSFRPTISKSGSRSATPTRKPETTHLTLSSASSLDKSSRTALKNSERVKSKPSKPSEIIRSLSHDVPQNPTTFMPKRPASISRGRPVSAQGTHSSRLSSNGQPRQKSCSPAKTRASIGATAHKIGSVMLSRSRSYNHSGGDDDVNPVLMGTKMVERVVNMRKLAPPKQDDQVSHDNKRKTSIEKSGFGRSLSSRSLDMAIRHMEIKQSVRDNLRPVSTSVLPSSLSGANRSSSSQSSAVGFTDSPLTSASDSSELSNCANSYFLYGREMDD